MGGHTVSIKKNWRMDPRAGLLLLVLANLIAFAQDCLWLEMGWIGVLTLLILAGRRFRSAAKWLIAYAVVLILQWVVLPVSPKIIATSFSIFANYARRMFPCLMVGSLLIHTVSLREFIVGLRMLYVPQKLIIPISDDAAVFSCDRDRLYPGRHAASEHPRRPEGEALIVPLMVSATATAEELSAAAVTRGIEDPVQKTSLVELHISVWDWAFMILAVGFLIAAFVL